MSYIVLDTETTNTLDDPICYDIGWSVLDKNFNIIKTKSFVVADVFIGEKELMKEAYFAEKIPQYFEDIADGKRTLKRFKNIRWELFKDCVENKVEAIVAHNSIFDYKACQTTQRFLTNSKFRWFFPYGVEIWDSLTMAREVFGKDENYIKYCTEKGYTTKYGKPRFTAEILYRFLSKDENFIESHTGLEDTLIEKEIFRECMNRNPLVKKSPWK